MGTVALRLTGSPALTAHEATGISLLLAVIGGPAATSLALKLRARAGSRVRGTDIVLTGAEKLALLQVLEELRQDRIPAHLRAIEEGLAAELGQAR